MLNTATTSTPHTTSRSPFALLAIDKSKVALKVLMFAAGPIFNDAPHVIRNFRDCHNAIRNAIYTFIVVFITGAFIYISATFTNFKGLIGLLASATGGINENNIFLKALLFYLDYFMTTHIAAAIANTALDASFTCCYGDREFALSKSKISELAKKFDVAENVVVEVFNNMREQFRNGVYAVGASKEEMENLLRAFAIKPAEEVKRRFEEHVNAFAHLQLLSDPDERRELLIQYGARLEAQAKKINLLRLVDSAVERAADRLDVPNPVSGLRHQYNAPSGAFPPIGTVEQRRDGLRMDIV